MDISHCGLTKVSRVLTWMTCFGNRWQAIGGDKIYDLTNDGFRVYLNQFGTQALISSKSALRPDFAKKREYELHYEVKGICNEIPGSV